MTGSHSRRRVLAASAAAASTALAGCGSVLDTGDPAPEQVAGRLFVENQMSESHRFRLRVASVSDGEGEEEVVFDERYRVPAETALRFEEVVESGNEYVVAVELQDAPESDDEWSYAVGACDEDAASDRVDATISIDSDQMDFTPYGCSSSVSIADDLELVDADEYRVTATTGTTGDPA